MGLQLGFLLQADHLRSGALGFQGLAAAFLLYLVGQVRLGLGTVLGGAVLGPAQLQLLVLLGDVGIGLGTGLVALLVGDGLADQGVALGLSPGDVRVPLLFGDVAHRQGVQHAVVIREILDGQVNDLQAHVLHVGGGGPLGLLGKLVPVLHQVGDGHPADDLTHVAFQHLHGHRGDVRLLPAQELLRRRGHGYVVAANFDIGHAVHHHADVLLAGHGLGGLDVHLHDAQVQLVHPFKEGNDERRSAADDAVTEYLDHVPARFVLHLVLVPPSGDDQRHVGGYLHIIAEEGNEYNQRHHAHNCIGIPILPEKHVSTSHKYTCAMQADFPAGRLPADVPLTAYHNFRKLSAISCKIPLFFSPNMKN